MKKLVKYNPYEDKELHYIQPEKRPTPIEERESFNDVMKHYDIVNGHQIPKRLDHFPRLTRNIIRIIITLMVMAFFAFQIWQIVSLIRSE